MPQCYLTGLEIAANQAYMLDKKAIQIRLWKIARERAHLSKLMDELAPLNHGNGNGDKRRCHRLVCKSIAKSLAHDTLPFEPFIPLRKYQISLHRERLQFLYEDAPPGSMFSALKPKDLNTIAERSWQVIGRLTPKFRRNKAFIKVLIELICPAFYILGEDEFQLNYMDTTGITKILISARADEDKVAKFEKSFRDLFSSPQIRTGENYGNVLK